MNLPPPESHLEIIRRERLKDGSYKVFGLYREAAPRRCILCKETTHDFQGIMNSEGTWLSRYSLHHDQAGCLRARAQMLERKRGGKKPGQKIPLHVPAGDHRKQHLGPPAKEIPGKASGKEAREGLTGGKPTTPGTKSAGGARGRKKPLEEQPSKTPGSAEQQKTTARNPASRKPAPKRTKTENSQAKPSRKLTGKKPAGKPAGGKSTQAKTGKKPVTKTTGKKPAGKPVASKSAQTKAGKKPAGRTPAPSRTKTEKSRAKAGKKPAGRRPASRAKRSTKTVRANNKAASKSSSDEVI